MIHTSKYKNTGSEGEGQNTLALGSRQRDVSFASPFSVDGGAGFEILV